MTGASKNLHDRNNNKKEKNEQNNRRVNVEERPKVPLRSLSLPKMPSGANALKISDHQLDPRSPGDRM